MFCIFNFIFQICLNDEELPYAYTIDTIPETPYKFSFENNKNAFMIFRTKKFNASITVSNHTTYFTQSFSHFFVPFSNFSIFSSQSLSILYWVLPQNVCQYNNSVIGTERYISSALYFHDTPIDTCIFLENIDGNVELNQTFKDVSGRAIYNGTTLSTAPLFFLIHPSPNGIFSLSYETHETDQNLKDSCIYQSSYHFTGSSFIPDYNVTLEYLHDCKIQSIQNKWWIYFIAISFIIFIALIVWLVIIFKYHKGNCFNNKESYSTIVDEPDEIFFHQNTSDEPPIAKPVYSYTQPSEQTDLLFYDKSKSN